MLTVNIICVGNLKEKYWRDACAEYGIRNCEDAEDYNNLLRGLGQDAMDNAWLPDDEEGMVMS